MPQKKWVLLAVFAAFVATSVALPHIAHAQQQSQSIAERIIEFAIGGVGKLIIDVLGLLMGALQWLTKFAVQFIAAIIRVSDFQNVAIVELGWHITLDFVNLLFILILLVIGFATIFRMETYGIKALLPRLIIVALFINFSKVIAGVIIDVGNLLAQFFLTPMGDPANLSTALMNLLNLQKSMDVHWNEVSKIAGTTAQTVRVTGAIVFAQFLGLVAMAVVVVGMFLYAGVFVVRIVVLWLLVIVAPFAWIASILPNTRRYFQMWWSNFIKWVMIAPIMVFFLFLLAAMGKEAGDYGLTGFVDSQGSKLKQTNSITTFADDPRFLLQYAIVMGFIFAGPIAANQMGAMGASAAIGIASAGQRWVLNQAGRAGKAAGLAPVKFGAKRAGERLAPRVQRAGEWLGNTQFAQSRLGRVLGVGALARAGTRAGAANEDTIKKEMGELSKQSTRELATTTLTKGNLNRNQTIALGRVLSSRNDFDDLPEDTRRALTNRLRNVARVSRLGGTGMERELLMNRPDLADTAINPVTGRSEQQEMIERGRKRGVKYSEDVLENADVLQGLQAVYGPQFRYFLDSLSDTAKETIAQTIEETRINDDFTDAISNEWRGYLMRLTNNFERAYGAALPAGTTRNPVARAAARAVQNAAVLPGLGGIGTPAGTTQEQERNTQIAMRAQSLSAEKASRLSNADVDLVAEHVSSAQVGEFGSSRDLSPNQKQRIRVRIEAVRDQHIRTVLGLPAGVPVPIFAALTPGQSTTVFGMLTEGQRRILHGGGPTGRPPRPTDPPDSRFV